VAIAREDQAYKNVSLSLADNDESRKWIRENYSDLTSFTLLEAEKFGRVLPNMYLAQMSQEIESAVKNLYRVDGDNAYVGDLLATYYQNSNQTVLEIEVREKLRSVDPFNRYLELALAKAYSRVGDEAKLRDSVDRLRQLSSDSLEYQESLLLVDDRISTP
jgi:predicted Zn-dependent protease